MKGSISSSAKSVEGRSGYYLGVSVRISGPPRGLISRRNSILIDANAPRLVPTQRTNPCPSSSAAPSASATKTPRVTSHASSTMNSEYSYR